MFSRAITDEHVKETLEKGIVIESYEDDVPYPSYLVMGIINKRVFHVVAAVNKLENNTIIITVYEPSPDLWYEDFRKRKKK
jgi:ribosome recycling factor